MESQHSEVAILQNKVPIELFHLFEWQPECSMVDDVYVSDRHLHKEIEMVFIVKGHLDVKIVERFFQLQQGELLCIRGNVLHQYMPKMPDTDIAKIKVMEEWLMPPFFQPHEKDAYQRLYSNVFKVKPDERVRKLVIDMLTQTLPTYHKYMIFGKLVELTALLLSDPSLINERMPVDQENLRYMESARSYIYDHCSRKLTLKMLADHLGLTESYCSKYIKRNAGISFVEYLNVIRLNNAQRLLIYTDGSITEIVEQAGFTSVQTFNRVFKAQMGRSPSEYRRQKRAQASKSQ